MAKVAVIKTQPTSSSVEDFINSIEDEQKRKDSFVVLKLMENAMKIKPKMWGSSMIGFGDVRYKSPTSGREVDWFNIGFSPRKANLSLHLIDMHRHAGALTKLGKFKLPVEIISFGSVLTLAKIEALGGKPVVRQKDGKDFITDNGNLIADCSFYPIENPKALHEQLKQMTGVVETGIFPSSVVTAVIAAYASGETKQFDF